MRKYEPNKKEGWSPLKQAECREEGRQGKYGVSRWPGARAQGSDSDRYKLHYGACLNPEHRNHQLILSRRLR